MPPRPLQHGEDSTDSMRKVARLLVVSVLGLVVLTLGFEVATGRVARSYRTLPADAQIDVGGTDESLASFAASYQPLIEIDPDLPSPPLDEVRFEVIPRGSQYTLMYFIEWRDEVHPNPVVNALYWVYRAAHYGFPVRDIEYVQVDVGRATGDVERIRFETTFGAGYSDEQQQHYVALYQAKDSHSFTERIETLDGQRVRFAPAVKPLFEGSRVRITPASWNHLSRLALASDRNLHPQAHIPLRYLTADDFASGKYARKSQGDVRTTEPRWVAQTEYIGLAVYLVGVIGLVVRSAISTRRRRR